MNPLAPILLSDARAVAASPVDCLVIGSGTSGVTTAIELAGRGLKVVILEAGPLVLTEHVGSGPFANRADIVPQIHDLVRYGTVWTPEKNLAAAQAGSVKSNNNAWSVVGGRTVFWGGCTPLSRRRFCRVALRRRRDASVVRAPKIDRGVGCRGRQYGAGFHDPRRAGPFVGPARRTGIHATHAPLCIDTRAVHGGRMSLGFDSSVSRLVDAPLRPFREGARLSLAETQASSSS